MAFVPFSPVSLSLQHLCIHSFYLLIVYMYIHVGIVYMNMYTCRLVHVHVGIVYMNMYTCRLVDLYMYM